MHYSAYYASPLGRLQLASDGESLAGLWSEGQKYHGATVKENMTLKDSLPIFIEAKKWLDRYFDGQKPSISELSLAPDGSEFRQVVWGILRRIPYGETTTYGEIAKQAAAQMKKQGMSGQAVGGAVGHNPISIIIPCHRVVGANGSLTGYAGGIERKIKLLEHEGANMSRFFIPAYGTAL